MNSYMKTFLIALAFLVGVGGVSMVSAQSLATMPVLYNQNGAAVNTGAGSLIAGYYFLGGSQAQGGHQVYYYGNGTFYDPTTLTYGGSVRDPSGTAGVNLGYGTTVTPGLPNTGLGGDAATNWIVLGIMALVAVSGVTYLGMSRRTAVAVR
jgi:hypothetical protein